MADDVIIARVGLCVDGRWAYIIAGEERAYAATQEEAERAVEAHFGLTR